MTHRQSPIRSALLVGGLVLGTIAACRTGSPPGEAPGDSSRSGGATATPAAVPAAHPAAAKVLPGLEVLLRDSLHLVRGKRVGFITNQSAVTSTGESGIDLLARSRDFRLVALYGPEHGLRGGVEGGTEIASSRDEKTGLPVFSLYGRTQKPTPEMLRGIDVLVFDMQDIGARPYTFVWTMAMAMEAAAAQKIPFVVLDRPNPITAAADGPPMHMDVRNVTQVITGYYTVPLRHGMTAGEVARYYNADAKIGADLHVVPAAGWRGNMWFDQTGLPWVSPSPNIRSLDAALKYSGMVLAEATNLTVGRGTDAPFTYLGAPWMNATAVLARARTYNLPGVRLDTVGFVPSSPDPKAYIPFRGERVHAIRLTVTDRDRFDPPLTALVLLTEIRRLHPTQFKITDDGFTQMIGSRWARQAFDRGDDPRQIARRWEQELAQWETVRNRYRLYPAR